MASVDARRRSQEERSQPRQAPELPMRLQTTIRLQQHVEFDQQDPDTQCTRVLSYVAITQGDQRVVSSGRTTVVRVTTVLRISMRRRSRRPPAPRRRHTCG